MLSHLDLRHDAVNFIANAVERTVITSLAKASGKLI
jgi:hypothetical protein